MSHPSGAVDLGAVRAGIDDLDRQIVALLVRRAALVERAGRLKPGVDAVPAPARVAQVVARVRTLAAEAGGDPDLMERLYRALSGEFVAHERAQVAGREAGSERHS